MEDQVVMILVVVFYLAFCILWGFWQGRKVKTGNDYAIAGRKLPGWAAALSERSTGESSWALLGLPGAAYATGLAEIWTAAGCVAGIITAWAFLAWRLRDEAEKYNVSTFTEYLEVKHGKSGRTLRTISSLPLAELLSLPSLFPLGHSTKRITHTAGLYSFSRCAYFCRISYTKILSV